MHRIACKHASMIPFDPLIIIYELLRSYTKPAILFASYIIVLLFSSVNSKYSQIYEYLYTFMYIFSLAYRFGMLYSMNSLKNTRT